MSLLNAPKQINPSLNNLTSSIWGDITKIKLKQIQIIQNSPSHFPFHLMQSLKFSIYGFLNPQGFLFFTLRSPPNSQSIYKYHLG